ncbi:MAG: hypothetical protein ABIN91_11030 [Mucilaginibacter sp.]|uniref:hypothetical protein n=1 Tax=Mucilaginibacter sp. TaxID=1882438 RepID=UPI0032673072
MTEEQLATATEDEVKDFIRLILIKDGVIGIKDRYRFDMSGYETTTGECTINNMAILNKFAFLGLYDYTNFLFLDFYKGTPTLYFEYLYSGDGGLNSLKFSGYTTTEIIYEVLKVTVLSGKGTRRRN